MPVSELADRQARQAALDTSRSVLVQAPAGSGKTELLAMRILKLLTMVAEPEEVLGITFTKAATAEMRRRIIDKLEAAKRHTSDPNGPEGEDPEHLEIACTALENSERRGWRLLERPQRLNIATIDSLCLRIVRQMPLQARLSGILEPLEDARTLYRRAARRTLDQLGGDDGRLNAALRALLLLRDSNLENCESLLAEMLATRDQWKHAFPLTGDIDWENARAELERPFQRDINRVLDSVREILSSQPGLAGELLDLARYACKNANSTFRIQRLASAAELPPPSAEFIDDWLCVCEFLLTQANQLRKSYNVNSGFPTGDTGQKARMLTVINALRSMPPLVGQLAEIRKLPTPHYSEEQWEILRHMFTSLRQAVRELDLVFAGERQVDFVEIGMAAVSVLSKDTAGELSRGVRHLLVDEFQDTSRRQHELIEQIVRDWRPGDGRTAFLVGDPMQSIYMFRQADVELFNLVRDRGFDTAVGILPVSTVHLQTNFRSNGSVVNSLNEIFTIIFPHRRKTGAAGVDFLPGVANGLDRLPGLLSVHTDFLPATSNGPVGASLITAAQQREALAVVGVVRDHLPKVEQARGEGKEFTIAILARVKDHLLGIARALRDEDIPFRAIELETLGARQEVLDLRSLTRALLHPMDRIAWLAVLRAPWCGLALRDLHLLCGTDDRPSVPQSVQKQVESRSHLLDDDSRRRVSRLFSVLNRAPRVRYNQTSLATWVEGVWRSLGGPECIDAAGYENALAYFRMLEDVAPDGIAATGETMDDRLDRLFASPDPAASERHGVQLMTIHKAKGLGFDVVIVPALHRNSKRDDPSLIRYLERARDTGTELLVAPIGAKGEQASRLNDWVRRQKEAREAEERKRLLYVACTRARHELHLFATATVTAGRLSYSPGSLLETAWPALAYIFERDHVEQTKKSTSQIAACPAPVSASNGGVGTMVALAATPAPFTLRRLPSDWKPDKQFPNATPAAAILQATADERPSRKASRTSRALGTVVHALFESAVLELEKGISADDLRLAALRWQSLATALARNEGLDLGQAELCGKEAAAALAMTLIDPYGKWILKPRPEAQAETSWTGFLDGVSRTLRIDRSFYSGSEPLGEGTDCLWIIDYKTADHSESGLNHFFASERSQYEKQLEDYGRMMRLVHGENLKLRLGLYYPLLKRLVWWPA
jgi:ATP-dependent exoDNAse (exonuclease V) beta subunit